MRKRFLANAYDAFWDVNRVLELRVHETAGANMLAFTADANRDDVTTIE